ncbi:MAG: arylsulfotransferase family protein [Gaiellaceae bacterium]
MPESWTRAEFLRRAAGTGAGAFLVAGGGSFAYELLEAGPAEAATGSPGVHNFRTRPDLRPPIVEVVHPAQETADGYLFITPLSGPGQRGVQMLDDRGNVVWFRPVPNGIAALNFRAQTYKGKPVLTWWQGKALQGLGVGHCVIADQSYREIARFKAGRQPADLHEFLITPHDTALVTSNEVRTMDLTSVGGPSSWPVVGSVIHELAIPSGRVLLAWHSLDHVGLDESHQTIGPQFDYFHANSIDMDGQGNLLISARNTWAIYKVSRKTGEVIWRLGGKKSDFAMGAGTVFAWQHDARFHEHGRLVSLFDDGAEPKAEPESRALMLTLDTRRMHARLTRRYTHRPALLATHTGSAQLQPNGNMLVGWGSERYFTEFASNGTVRFDARLPRGGQTYRALRFPWVGKPTVPPLLVTRPSPSGRIGYASWNGATEVASWQLLAGPAAGALQEALTKSRGGFETRLPIPKGMRYAAVVALDEAGNELRRSKTIRV